MYIPLLPSDGGGAWGRGLGKLSPPSKVLRTLRSGLSPTRVKAFYFYVFSIFTFIDRLSC